MASRGASLERYRARSVEILKYCTDMCMQRLYTQINVLQEDQKSIKKQAGMEILSHFD